jgi:CrcB protein
MYQLGLVALGGGIGASCRHLVNVLAARLLGAGFPAGTLTANVLGGLLMGILAGFLAVRYATGGQGIRLFLGTGLLGGFTTFSAFSLDAVLLWQRGEPVAAIGYVLASVVLSIAALLAGLSLSRVFA